VFSLHYVYHNNYLLIKTLKITLLHDILKMYIHYLIMPTDHLTAPVDIHLKALYMGVVPTAMSIFSIQPEQS